MPLYMFLLGIKANRITVKIVKMVTVCPDGKLLKPCNVLPTIIKLSSFKISAGRGIKNKSLKNLQKTAETSKAESNYSQTLGA